MNLIDKFTRLEPAEQGVITAGVAGVVMAAATVFATSRVVHEGTRRAFPEGGPKEVVARVAGTAALLWLAADANASYPAPPPFTTIHWIAERLGHEQVVPPQQLQK